MHRLPTAASLAAGATAVALAFCTAGPASAATATPKVPVPSAYGAVSAAQLTHVKSVAAGGIDALSASVKSGRVTFVAKAPAARRAAITKAATTALNTTHAQRGVATAARTPKQAVLALLNAWIAASDFHDQGATTALPSETVWGQKRAVRVLSQASDDLQALLASATKSGDFVASDQAALVEALTADATTIAALQADVVDAPSVDSVRHDVSVGRTIAALGHTRYSVVHRVDTQLAGDINDAIAEEKSLVAPAQAAGESTDSTAWLSQLAEVGETLAAAKTDAQRAVTTVLQATPASVLSDLVSVAGSLADARAQLLSAQLGLESIADGLGLGDGSDDGSDGSDNGMGGGSDDGPGHGDHGLPGLPGLPGVPLPIGLFH